MNQLLDPQELCSSAHPGQEVCIEFFGLPGSGKSTIASKVHAALSAMDPSMVFAPAILRDDARTPLRAVAKIRLVLSALARDGEISGTLREALTIQQPSIRDKLRAVFTLATVLSLYSNLGRRRIGAVLDQGALQAIWTIQLRQPAADADAFIANLLKRAATARHIYVSVETPTDVCAERLDARVSKHSRMQLADGDRDLDLWQRAERLRQTIINDFRATCRKQGIRPQIVTVDGSGNSEIVANQIVAALLQIWTELPSMRVLQNEGITE